MGGGKVKRRDCVTLWGWKTYGDVCVHVSATEPKWHHHFGWIGVDSTDVCFKQFNRITGSRVRDTTILQPTKFCAPKWTIVE